jgi:enoyl-CoA hydratase
MNTFENILITIENQIATLTINRPTKLNALNAKTIVELNESLHELENNPSVRAIILTGTGEKAFVAGADISEFAHFDEAAAQKLAQNGHELVFNRIENFKKPIIAAINGFALGGGLELAMACHFRVAATTAKMGLPEVSLGVIPGYGGTQRLPQLIGKGRALEMIMTATIVDALEAHRVGLVNHVVPQEDLLAFCKELAGRIIKNAPIAISKAIEAVNAQFDDNKNGYETEIRAFASCFATQDFKEGTTAFLEKRKPVFQAT